MGRSIDLILAVAKKDILTWIRDPIFLLASILVPLVLLGVFSLVGFSSASMPLALNPVQGNNTDQATLILENLKSQVSSYFEIATDDSRDAKSMWNEGDVLGIVTYSGEEGDFDLEYLNINDDYTKNYRLRFAKAIGELALMDIEPGEAYVSSKESSLLPADIPIWKYIAVGLIGFAIAFSGIVNSGVMVAREWKERTIKEWLLSPSNMWIVFLGKVLAGLIQGIVNALIMFLAVEILFRIHVEGSWFLYLFIVLFLSILSIAIGILLGILVKRLDVMAPLGMLIVTTLWLTCGGLGPRGQLPDALWMVTKYIPFTYAFEGVHAVVETENMVGIYQDIGILVFSAVFALLIAIYLLKRSTVK